LHPTLGVLVFHHAWGGRLQERMQPCGRGWEVMLDPTLLEEYPKLVADALWTTEAEVPDPGRYDIVCDGTIMAHLVAHTIGVATELARVLGYEANAGGTSYLAPPEEVLGRYAYGGLPFSVTANRSAPGLAATTAWDDEGVAPSPYEVVKDGVVR